MSVEIRRALREKTYALVSLAGESGAGKTYSALLLARGLAGHEGSIGFIDTENKRSHFYADTVTQFDVYDMEPPFSPKRYIAAIQEFEKKGYPVLVIDSMSHEWEGIGGCIDMANESEMKSGKPGLHNWKRPKAEHQMLVNTLLQANMHIIFCLRAREKMKQVFNDKAKKQEIVSVGVLPIAEKNFVFEMTVSLQLSPDNPGVPKILKCPDDLRSAFPAKKITTDAGVSLGKWCNEGSPTAPKPKDEPKPKPEPEPAPAQPQDDQLAKLQAEAYMAADAGTDMLKSWWVRMGKAKKANTLSEADYKTLGKLKNSLKKTAEEADAKAAGTDHPAVGQTLEEFMGEDPPPIE